jgi:xylan 1,4-beta-xylosidase
MKPIVEFDFFPTGMGKEFGAEMNDEFFDSKRGEPADWDAWEELLDKFMQNLVDTFGKEELRTWYFEVWNEPDGWPIEHMGIFHRLYDVFAHVVKSYDPDFKVGGPACYHIYFLRDFLNHVTYGTNYVTGETGSPLDFVSYHLYGLSGSWLDPAPNIIPTVQRFNVELLWVQRLLDNYDLDESVEFHVNEWGQSSHFQRSSKDHPELQYRDNERGALFMTKAVDCMFALEDNYGLVTSLLGYWGFCWEAKQSELFIGNRELTTAGNVPKPILTGYEMLARLGAERLSSDGPQPGNRTGVLATRDGGNRFPIIAYNYNETDDDLTISDQIDLTLTNLSGQQLTVAFYLLDRKHHNTYRAWERMGSPAEVTPNIAEQLIAEAELQPTEQRTMEIQNGTTKLTVKLPRHSMMLLEIVAE